MKFWTNLALSLVFLLSTGCFKNSTPEKTTPKKSIVESNKLNKTILSPGDGAVASEGKFVDVHYTGWLYNSEKPEGKGKKFDSSKDRGLSFSFRLGAKTVIPGWEEGVKGMKVGEKARLTIPPKMAYGERGVAQVIPPNSTLIFDIELLAVK